MNGILYFYEKKTSKEAEAGAEYDSGGSKFNVSRTGVRSPKKETEDIWQEHICD